MADRGKGAHKGEHTVVQNRRARFDFEITDSVEAGLVLLGTEVKSLRNGGGVLSDAWAEVVRGEVWLNAMKIAPYSHGNITNHATERRRKLLLHQREIRQLEQEAQRGLQLVPLRVYFKEGRAKLELGVGKPRKAHDKRHAIRDREQRAEARRAVSNRGRGDD
ncbi:MAG: SsrA-binding protein SmpB [Deltaproteobacteria bacterium]|nr:SsrA-binding protein SmpB [Deltaproteobacteria bacterium]